MKKILITIGLSAAVISVSADISLNFNPGASGTVSGTEVVGLNGVQAASWIDVGASATAVDIDGVAGSATIDFVSAYNFEATSDLSGYQDGTQNAAMMRRAIRVGGPGDATITISGLGTEYTTLGYDVFVYYGTDNHTRSHRFSVGGTAVAGTEQAPASWQGSFVQTFGNTEVGNYAVAESLTAASFTIVDNGTTPGKGGIAGIEIIAIPEPATIGMVAVFGGGLLFIRRRMMI